MVKYSVNYKCFPSKKIIAMAQLCEVLRTFLDCNAQTAMYVNCKLPD